MLKNIRVFLAVISIVMITLCFVDFTGLAAEWFGWTVKIQFLPALLALNFVAVAALVLVTLLLGRVYCSVICPLGVMQDMFGWLGRKSKKYRYSYSPAKNILRIIFFCIMVVAIIAGLGIVVSLLAPYSAYGRICSNLLAPVWAGANNVLASIAESNDSYAFYKVDAGIRSWTVFGVAVATLVILGCLSWRNGRTYCNTVCPVGTLLGFLSRFSLFAPVIDKSKCNACGLCSRNCKASCIDGKKHSIDYSRCVACMDCIETCNHNAISYGLRCGHKQDEAENQDPAPVSGSRRTFVVTSLAVAGAAALKAQEKKVDGGLAVIEDKQIPERKVRIVPPGAISLRNLSEHCTSCQLCISACPEGVIRPSGDLEWFMKPESSYEKGYCRPECTRCSDVCPTGAIIPVTAAEKSAIQIGHAVWVSKNCVPLVDGVACGNCARHCPTGAIQMVNSVAGDESSLKIPAVNIEKCIGCGACENLCPARPFSAIYVEGHENHRTI